ncbi:MAG TPA: sigma-70 family RNA polymerase sigma factor [Thermoanaerobaculia bacterium]|nr:sigma-70 family RNA polymerase sigma factor [Thermoanaerobaculia bacterium]
MEAVEIGDVMAAHDYDRLLAERHRHGDPEAFSELYDRFSSMVFGLAYRLIGNREEAADVAQEVFLRIFRHLGRFRGRSSLKTWIYRITMNQCRSYLARRRRPGISLADEHPENGMELEATALGPERRAAGHELGSRLNHALAEMSPKLREAVLLRDLEGLDYREIGRILKVRPGTVRSRIARGREQLRQLLGET